MVVKIFLRRWAKSWRNNFRWSISFTPPCRGNSGCDTQRDLSLKLHATSRTLVSIVNSPAMASLPSMGPAWMPLVRSVNAKARFLGSLYASVNQISMFTTTSPFLAAGPKKSSVRTGVQKGQRNTVVRKNRTIQKPTGRRIEPGERKAFRKRVVLSNTNALEVEGLQELTAESLQNADEVRGKMMALPGSIVDSLRAVDAFKPTQCWHMYRKPAVMMTEEAVELAKTMTESVSKQKSTARRIIVGERMCGKTTFLLQAMSMAFLKGWVVVNLPDGM